MQHTKGWSVTLTRLLIMISHTSSQYNIQDMCAYMTYNPLSPNHIDRIDISHFSKIVLEYKRLNLIFLFNLSRNLLKLKQKSNNNAFFPDLRVKKEKKGY